MSKPLKVCIGFKLRSGPWGGGNQFANSLTAFLKDNGITVVDNLKDNDIDIVMLTDPRKNSSSAAFSVRELVSYLCFRNPRAKVIHRINECDERKGTNHVNRQLMVVNQLADHTIFIGEWLKPLFEKQGMQVGPYSVCLNGGDTEVFNPNGRASWQPGQPLRLVTHHWGGFFLKGFDIYEAIDKKLAQQEFKERFAFTYIGKTPKDFKFYNSTLEAPTSGNDLAQKLKQNHIYVTGSQFEPAGMHHVEGALCGLPLLYRESGALPEYCNGFGLGFVLENFFQQLDQLAANYESWRQTILSYGNTAEKMCQSYLDAIQEVATRPLEPRNRLETFKIYLEFLFKT